MNRGHRALAPAFMTYILTVALYAQSRRVSVRYEVDGKPKAAPKTMELYDTRGRRIVTLPIHNGLIEVPVLQPSQIVEVHIHFDKRILIFPGVHETKFQGAWTVGIDRPPFDEENASSIPAGRKPKEIWFITFDPINAESTQELVMRW